MIENIQKLSVEDNNERFEQLCKILDESDIGYFIQEIIMDKRLARNIIIRVGAGNPRLAVGAHHDSVEGSTGANDNMSGVVILIKLAKELLLSPPSYPLDIIFFDHEETGALGSRAYAEEYKDETLAMINLDICGFGDSIIIGPDHHSRSGILGEAIGKLDCSKHIFHILKMLPPGDDRIFENAGIPNISVGIVENKDVRPMSTLFDENKDVSKDKYPSIIETMHNGPRDSVEIIDPEALDKVLNFTKDIVLLFSL